MRTRPLILAVDDLAENLDIVTMRLEAQGYEVRRAPNGQEALQLAYELVPDLILLDVMMPGIDGIEVTRRLKADETMRAIPILLLTARSSTHDVVAGLEAGGDDYLTKPFDQMTLVARVRSLLRIKGISADCGASCRRSSPTSSSSRAATPRSCSTIGGRSSCYSATCAASRASRRRPSPRR